MLQNRGFPQKGYLFVSQKNERFTPRFINDMLKAVVKHHLSHKAELWKTKHLRDSYMNGLLKAKLTQETKDAMVGHKRRGARSHYTISEDTITEAYDSAFKSLTVNGVGSSTRKIEQLEKDSKRRYAELGQAIAELRKDNKELRKTLKVFMEAFKRSEEKIAELEAQ